MNIDMIRKERVDEIEELFWLETNEEWTQDWRESLTAEETALVNEWDNRVEAGMYRLAKRILELDRIKRKNAESDIRP